MQTQTPEIIEQKVREQITKKLFLKEEERFLNNPDSISVLIDDIVLLAKSESDIYKAMGFDSEDESRRIDLEIVAADYAPEIAAYIFYLEAMETETNEDEIYDGVFLALNSDKKLLERRLHQLMMMSLSGRVKEEDANELGVERWALISNFANQVKFIASHETIPQAVEEAFTEYSTHPELKEISKADIECEFNRFVPLAVNEINAYKLALEIAPQSADINMVLAMVQQLLRVEI
ncbi:MAG: hypothetical protein PHV20_13955 [Bacteroidales bacterium]|nr:hypothetical protein [Bacteroidales bacterium]